MSSLSSAAAAALTAAAAAAAASPSTANDDGDSFDADNPPPLQRRLSFSFSSPDAGRMRVPSVIDAQALSVEHMPAVHALVGEAVQADSNWTTLDEALRDHVWCVDARAEFPLVGVPGGSMGAFVRTTIAFLEAAQDPTERARVAEFLESHADEMMAELNAFSHLCQHSDDFATEQRLGCGYLNLVRNYPTEYGLNESSLYAAMLGAFDSHHRRDIDYITVHGELRPEAVIIVESVDGSSLLRLIPRTSHIKAFVFHPDMEKALTQKMARIMFAFMQHHNLPLTFTIDGVFEGLIDVTATHVQYVLNTLAKGLARFHVRVQGRKVVSISEERP